MNARNRLHSFFASQIKTPYYKVQRYLADTAEITKVVQMILRLNKKTNSVRISNNLEELVPSPKLLKFHRDFRRTASSRLFKKIMFARITLNRIIQSVWILYRNPIVVKKAISSAISALRGKDKCLRSLEIAITYRCNAHCSQCSCRLEYDPVREKAELLEINEIFSAIDQAVELGAFQFCINGGEPMLEKEKVFQVLDYVKKHKSYAHLCTNGILLDEQTIRELKNHGLDSLEMGFDSSIEETHDRNRRKGSFQKILDNINHCHKYGIRVVLNTILTNDKVMSDDMIYTFLLAKKLGCMLQITPCCLTGALKNRIDKMLTKKAILYFYWLLSKSWNNRTDLYSSLTTIKCPAAREKIGLQPYGDVVSCPLIQIRYGNIRRKSLREIREGMMSNPYYSGSNAESCLPAMSETFIREYLIDNGM